MLKDLALHFIDEYLIYLRKSRSDSPGESVEEVLKRHEMQLQEFAERELGEKIKEENIYREVVSGETIDDRPQLLKMLNRIEKGNIKGVLVIEPQRLSRGDLMDCGRIVQFFQYTSTLIMTPVKTYNLEEKYDRKFFESELLRGNDFLEYTKEILARGRMASIKEGKYIGATPPFGYDKQKLKREKGYKLIIKEDEAEIVRMMFEMACENAGTSNIANHLNKIQVKPRKSDFWTPVAVRNILTNPEYYGAITWEKRKQVQTLKDGKIIKTRPRNKNYILVKGIHDPIISKETFDRVQDILKSNASPKVVSSKNIQNPLATLVYCQKCGYAMIRRPQAISKYGKKRVYEIDREKLSKLLRDYHKASGLTITEISNCLKVSRNVVRFWFTENINKFIIAKSFSNHWYQLKELLGIETDEFDKAITTYKPRDARDALICSIPHCKNVSSYLDVVEKNVLNAIQEHFENYQYFIDNYEEEVFKSAKNNLKLLAKVEKKIQSLQKELKTARRNYNREEYSKEEYFEIKAEVEEELTELLQTKEELEKDEQEEKIKRYKKAIPVLANCLKNYHTLNVTQKNELLKSIIEKVTYQKDQVGRKNKDVSNSIDLKVYLKI